MLWSFIDACARGRLPFDECSPAFYVAGIAVLILVALLALTALILRRTRKPG